MGIATINPATGELVKSFDPLTDEQLEDKLARAARAFRDYRLTGVDERAGWLRAAADVLDKDGDHIAEVMTLEMGKTLVAAKAAAHKAAAATDAHIARDGASLSETQVRESLAVLRRTRPGVLGRCPGRRRCGRCRASIRQLSTDRCGAGDHAVELPALAGDALRRTGVDGRQRRTAQARQQCAADGAVSGGAVPQGGLPGRRVPDAADRLVRGREGAARSARCCRDADRQRTGRAVGRRHRRRRAEEDRPRARWQRPLRRHAVRRPGQGGRGRSDGAVPEQRAELYRREALHRPRGRGGRVRAVVRGEAGRAAGRGPDGREDQGRATRDRIRPTSRNSSRTRSPRVRGS